MDATEADRRIRQAIAQRDEHEAQRAKAYRDIDAHTNGIVNAQHLIDRLLDERAKA